MSSRHPAIGEHAHNGRGRFPGDHRGPGAATEYQRGIPAHPHIRGAGAGQAQIFRAWTLRVGCLLRARARCRHRRDLSLVPAMPVARQLATASPPQGVKMGWATYKRVAEGAFRAADIRATGTVGVGAGH